MVPGLARGEGSRVQSKRLGLIEGEVSVELLHPVRYGAAEVGGEVGKFMHYAQKPKSTLLADNTKSLITTKQTKPRPVTSTVSKVKMELFIEWCMQCVRASRGGGGSEMRSSMISLGFFKQMVRFIPGAKLVNRILDFSHGPYFTWLNQVGFPKFSNVRVSSLQKIGKAG